MQTIGSKMKKCNMTRITALCCCLLVTTLRALDFGGGNVASNLDLSTSSLTDTVLKVTSTLITVTNTAMIGSGQELRINGNVTVGSETNNSYSILIMSGSGRFSVTNASRIQVGGATGGGRKNAGYLDMRGLETFTAHSSSSAGDIRIGNAIGSSSGWGLSIQNTIILASNSLVKTGAISLGVGTEDTVENLRLGSGDTILNVNTNNVGGSRASGNMVFDTSTGKMKVRGYGGADTDRTTLNVGVGLSAGTSYSHVIDFRGHLIDLMLSTLTLPTFGIGTGTAGSNNGTVSMDAGVIDVNDIYMGALTGGSGAKRTIAATINLHGGTTTVHNAIIMATNFVSAVDSLAHTVTATLSISNAVVSVLNQASPGTPALSLATMGPNASAAAVANGSLFIFKDGGLTVAGNIVDGGNSALGGVATTTINLNSGALLMPNSAILNVDNFTMTNATLAVGVYAGLPVLANRGTGTLAPGGLNAVGSTIISNSYVQASTATLDIDLVSKLSYDRVTVTGGVTLAGSIYMRAPAGLSGEFDIVTSDTAITDTTVLTGASTGFTKTLVNDNKTIRLFKAPPGTMVSFL